jgi:hypothetical protein
LHDEQPQTESRRKKNEAKAIQSITDVTKCQLGVASSALESYGNVSAAIEAILNGEYEIDDGWEKIKTKNERTTETEKKKERQKEEALIRHKKYFLH